MKISDLLSINNNYLDPEISSDLYSKLLNDFGVSSESVTFVGAKKFKYDKFSETYILYGFPKDSKEIGKCLKNLGVLVNRIPLKPGDDFGIQEIDVTQSDKYYIMFYLLEETREKILKNKNE